jgi:hypothetical protein
VSNIGAPTYNLSKYLAGLPIPQVGRSSHHVRRTGGSCGCLRRSLPVQPYAYNAVPYAEDGADSLTATSVRNYHYWLRNNSAECSSRLLRGGSLKLRMLNAVLKVVC